jgi:sulfur carrier protein
LTKARVDVDTVVNGTQVHIDAANLIRELLRALGLHGNRVAMEHNGQIAPRSEHDRTRITPHDCIEIVAAVGGG